MLKVNNGLSLIAIIITMIFYQLKHYMYHFYKDTKWHIQFLEDKNIQPIKYVNF